MPELTHEEALETSLAYFQVRQKKDVATFLPGDTHSGLQVETQFSDIHSDLILLPIYLFSYRYRGRLFRLLINGQNGKVRGEKPLSALRVTLFILGLVGLGAGLFWLISSLT